MNTHKELIPNSVGDWTERDVPDGYHYELQLLNGVWQWVLVADALSTELAYDEVEVLAIDLEKVEE